ncbi:MAG: 50S ribosomal protein L18 [Theionarchaea archaeon]|nr:50S ribosomal protein L18 [Theionarchaea archaeon]MBU7001767.1 50S ribosomal protein L18 [Theionarchaea archaeon]MBU7022284.1 50S ribosomal protein L18 [Theionarchaea archaeon]MBU7035518.1 50S ribosomal protein L18 [Theionarchaea archaeon]MBU7041135.1 50S ribosomal protein L18 [Theionarchaea archaeon]
MAHGPRYRVASRRRREGKTDYHQRITMVRSGRDRLVVRKSLKHVAVQVVRAETQGDKTLACAHSGELKSFGWSLPTSNIPAAYLTGYLCGVRALKEGIEKAVLDIGVNRIVPGSRLFAALKGAADAGLDIPYGETILPSEDRIKGAHITAGDAVDSVLKNMKEAVA